MSKAINYDGPNALVHRSAEPPARLGKMSMRETYFFVFAAFPVAKVHVASTLSQRGVLQGKRKQPQALKTPENGVQLLVSRRLKGRAELDRTTVAPGRSV